MKKMIKHPKPDETFQIEFRNQIIDAYKLNGEIYVGVRKICNNLRVDTPSQIKKLKNNQVVTLTECDIPSSNGIKNTYVLLLKDLNYWLATISANKIKDSEIRTNLIEYQKECAIVLWEYFSNSKKASTDTVNQNTILQMQLDNQKMIMQMQSDNQKMMETLFTFIREVNFATLTRADIPKQLQEPSVPEQTSRQRLNEIMKEIGKDAGYREVWNHLYSKVLNRLSINLKLRAKNHPNKNIRALDIAEELDIIDKMIALALEMKQESY